MASEGVPVACGFSELPSDDEVSKTNASSKTKLLPRVAGVVLFGGICALIATYQTSFPRTPRRFENPTEFNAPATIKRGFGGFTSEFTCGDAKAVGLGDSWYYSWIQAPYGKANKCAWKKKGLAKEFVPMINGIPSSSRTLEQFQANNKALPKTLQQQANIHFLLGYNEPDASPSHPMSCEPADGAKAWPNVQQTAALFNPPLTLISPCPASEAFDDHGRSWWLDQFFGNCTGACDPSQIKYIAMHDYTGDAQLMMQRIEGASKYYGRKIWLTEYGIIQTGRCQGRTPDEERHEAYMKETIPLLDNSPAVYRYAWFAGRQTPNVCAGSSGLLPYDSLDTTPTKLGHIYGTFHRED